MIIHGTLCRSGLGREVSDSEKVVNCRSESKRPGDALFASAAHLSAEADGFQPAEDFFNELTLLLAHIVAGTPDGSRGHDASAVRVVPGDMWSNVQGAELTYESECIVSFVRPQRYPTALIVSAQAP